MPKTVSTPRIITLTVKRMRELAADLRADGLPGDAERLRKWADELDAHDARESRLEPSKRKAKRSR